MRVVVKSEPGDAARLPEDWHVPENLRLPPDTPEEVRKDAEAAVRDYELDRRRKIVRRRNMAHKHGSHGGGD